MTSIAPGYVPLRGDANLLDSNDPTARKLSNAEYEVLRVRLERLPELQTRVDYAALRDDPLFHALRTAKQAKVTFHTQQIAQASTADAVAAGAEPVEIDNESGAVKAFLDYMAKSPEERYFEAFLKSRGMTAEDFQAMSPAEQQGLLTEFEDTLKQRLGDATAERIARSARRNWL